MENWLSRTELFIGEGAVSRLQSARVAVLGLGGVGGVAAEALARAGVGSLLLCDSDTVTITNLNRQIFATLPTLGMQKTEAASERLRSISEEISLTLENRFYLPEESDFLFDYEPDIVLDAIDTVSAKLHLALECYNRNIELVSCLGVGNRLSPQSIRIGDIHETVGCGCPLAKVVRRELKSLGVPSLRVVYSTEIPKKAVTDEEHGRHLPGSISFVPPVAGYIMAGEAVRMLIREESAKKTELIV